MRPLVALAFPVTCRHYPARDRIDGRGTVMSKDDESPTLLYLVHHGATEAGEGGDAPLARLGVRQAEATRALLAIRPIDHCYCSAALCARQTARILCGPHGIAPAAMDDLAERDAEEETLAEAQQRMDAALDALLERHAGRTLLVVGHRRANGAWLARLLGMARQVSLDNCGISVVTRQAGRTAVSTLNAAFHLQGVAA